MIDYGWVSERDIFGQCATCYWVLKEHRLGCCEFAKPQFPVAQHCDRFSEDGEECTTPNKII
jgi:hypothetical protein